MTRGSLPLIILSLAMTSAVALAIQFLFLLAAAAATFLHVVVDIHCSTVIIFLKGRRQKQEYYCWSERNNDFCENFDDSVPRNRSFRNSFLEGGGHSCCGGSLGSKMSGGQPPIQCEAGTSGAGQGSAKCQNKKKTGNGKEGERVAKDLILFGSNALNLGEGEDGSTFREMFVLGACIVVLTICVITRRRTFLSLPIPQAKTKSVAKLVEKDIPKRDPPVIELLDVLKGDFTSRAIRPQAGVVICSHYRIEKEIGRGGFSKVFLATDSKAGNRKVAVKTASRLLNQTKSLKRELAIYQDLQSSTTNPAIPYLIHYTEVDIKRMSILVMDLLGPSLEELFDACNKSFTLGTVACIMEQMLEVLRFLHGKFYIHRDIKPENILAGRLGTSGSSKIHLIDFGTVSKWRSEVNGKHVKRDYGVGRLGTNSYMSVNAHKGRTQSRKDDLEALGYCLFRFTKVTFPWSRYDDMNDGIKSVVTAKMKAEMDFDELFPVNAYPPEFPEYLKYVKALEFEAEPEYQMLSEKFRNLKENMRWDGFEWEKKDFLDKHPQWNVPD